MVQVYVCGVSEDDAAVPSTAADVTPREDAIDTLRGVAASVSQASFVLPAWGMCVLVHADGEHRYLVEQALPVEGALVASSSEVLEWSSQDLQSPVGLMMLPVVGV